MLMLCKDAFGSTQMIEVAEVKYFDHTVICSVYSIFEYRDMESHEMKNEVYERILEFYIPTYEDYEALISSASMSGYLDMRELTVCKDNKEKEYKSTLTNMIVNFGVAEFEKRALKFRNDNPSKF